MTGERSHDLRDADNGAVVAWATTAVHTHARDMSRAYCERFACSRSVAARQLGKLVDGGWLTKMGTTRPFYAPGPRRLVTFREKLPTEEHRVWLNNVQSYLSLSQNVGALAFHCFTEMLNNAVDHSHGEFAEVRVEQDEKLLYMLIADNGVGIFKRIADSFGLSSPREAILELYKGKVTTDPSRHSGQGIFFSSRMCDVFVIHANDLEFSHTSTNSHDLIIDKKLSSVSSGTTVFMIIQLESARDVASVFNEFSSPDADDGFAKTVIPVRRARFESEMLVSRSQAKRVYAGLEKFKTVILDFDQVDEVGQAFADELFRVFSRMHPDVNLILQNASEQILKMRKYAEASGPNLGQ